ncbi:MAG: MOSC N-terminal beta barrel domain-containing protein [Pseudomonadota bacterium]|nr:MOSC N-terminal beta barrel domain-containing protein [Pseudomonadota bacterium]
MAKVAGLWVYPLKSARGIARKALTVDPAGVRSDRRWMVVDAGRHFLTQRQLPAMARLSARPDAGGIVLSAPDVGTLEVAAPGAGAPVRRVQIWGQEVEARAAGDGAAAWLTKLLGRPCELVCLPDDKGRPLPPGYARSDEEAVGFADAFHVLLVGDGTFAELNGRLAAKGVAPVPLDRFRPNILVAGLAPAQEDRWQRVAIGGVVCRVAKPCERCLVTTVDQHSGVRHPDREPLKTLQEYRLDAQGNALFGQNLVVEGSGVIRVGDGVEPLG